MAWPCISVEDGSPCVWECVFRGQCNLFHKELNALTFSYQWFFTRVQEGGKTRCLQLIAGTEGCFTCGMGLPHVQPLSFDTQLHEKHVRGTDRFFPPPNCPLSWKARGCRCAWDLFQLTWAKGAWRRWRKGIFTPVSLQESHYQGKLSKWAGYAFFFFFFLK